MPDLQVVKKDGNLQAWNQDKLLASLHKIGIPDSKVTEVAPKVQEWARLNALDGRINSSQIRDKIIEELITEYPSQVENYKVYKKD